MDGVASSCARKVMPVLMRLQVRGRKGGETASSVATTASMGRNCMV